MARVWQTQKPGATLRLAGCVGHLQVVLQVIHLLAQNVNVIQQLRATCTLVAISAILVISTVNF